MCPFGYIFKRKPGRIYLVMQYTGKMDINSLFNLFGNCPLNQVLKVIFQISVQARHGMVGARFKTR